MGLTWHGGSPGVHQLLTAPGCPGPLLCRSALPCPALTPVPLPMPMPCSALHHLCPILPCPVLQSLPFLCSPPALLITTSAAPCQHLPRPALHCPALPCPALHQFSPLCACALFRLSLFLPLPCPAKGQDMTAYASSALHYSGPAMSYSANPALLSLAQLKMLGLYHDSSCLHKPCLCRPGSFWLSVTALCSLATVSARLLEEPTT